jgi:hypothetical protein
MECTDLFPASDYEFVLRVRRQNPADFFRQQDGSGEILAERARWLNTAVDHHLVCSRQAEPLVREFRQLLIDWQLLRDGETPADLPASELLNCLGRKLEPDFVLLRRDRGVARLAAGCVCFPSSWSLPEKQNLTVDEIHGIVPSLNRAIGRPIDQFLSRLAAGTAWCRANWGLSRWGELNQDPWRQLPRLTPEVSPAEIWLRVEHQALVALPQSDGVLFAIRVQTDRLSQVLLDRDVRHNFRRALASMPEDMVRYKGIEPVRASILSWIDAW